MIQEHASDTSSLFFLSLPRAFRLIVNIYFIPFFSSELCSLITRKKSYKEIILYKYKDIFVFFNVM